jgi:hypothetical protein
MTEGNRSNKRKRPLRPYKATIWGADPSAPGQRVNVLAASLGEARAKLEAEHSEGTVFDLHNEEDAARSREPW